LATGRTTRCNCIAWAAAKDDTWWWPPGGFNGYYWPPDVVKDATIESFVKAFESLGYQVCDSDNVEPDVDKVAIYADAAGEPNPCGTTIRVRVMEQQIGQSSRH